MATESAHRPATGGITEPSTGLQFVELSQEFGPHTPVYPGFPDIVIYRLATHAMHGVMSQQVRTVMHNGTHINAPVHLVQRGQGIGELPLDRFFGTGPVLAIPKGEWELIVERDIKLVGIDTATIDHPMATSLAGHRGGPVIKELPRQYKAKTGHTPEQDHGQWNIAHKTLLEAGIPTIENVGGEIDSIGGLRCAFHAYPWFWPEGDACITRLTAILDPSGDYRLGDGSAE